MTCLVSFIGWLWLPAGPGTAWFLNRDERVCATERIRIENEAFVNTTTCNERLTRKDLVETVKDWKLWYVLIFNVCASIPATALSVFLPLVVEGMGFSSIEANLVSFHILGVTKYRELLHH